MSVLNFLNCEGAYLVEGFLHNLGPLFDIVFAQLGVILRARSKFAVIVAVAECYLINYNSCEK